MSELRAALAAKWRALAQDYATRLGLPLTEKNVYLRRALAADGEEPLLAARWEIPAKARPHRREGEFFVVEADGTVRPAVRNVDGPFDQRPDEAP